MILVFARQRAYILGPLLGPPCSKERTILLLQHPWEGDGIEEKSGGHSNREEGRMSSSPQVSRSHSYPGPQDTPWLGGEKETDSTRKGSIDSNPPTPPHPPPPSMLSREEGRSALVNASDSLQPPRLKHGKATVEETKKKWRNSGAVVNNRVSFYNVFSKNSIYFHIPSFLQSFLTPYVM